MCKGLLDTPVQPLFCLLNLSFGGAHGSRGLLQTTSSHFAGLRNLKTHTAFISTVYVT